ncbi:nucleotide-binding protein [Rathayibacter sp. PhB127]|uniref:nucleotide-binding protein n=1 Tax=Rathayibacter sp. PhB127 TaxID=2485176 RepID=UPI001609CE1F|nr:nucleotide-binding protein [Rathayibacter sp. PhB127]
MSPRSTSSPEGLPSVFIGSSSEGITIAHYLQSALHGHGACEATIWAQGVFEISQFTLESLANAARRSDFAVLVATADDKADVRGQSRSVARDNVIFELGLFIGVLGRERTYIVVDRDDDLQLPSDLAGLTYLPYRRNDDNPRVAVAEAALQITEVVRRRGRRELLPPAGPSKARTETESLEREIERICVSARAQGWRVKTNSETTLRLQDRRGNKFTLSRTDAIETRAALRPYVAELRARGLRVNQSVRRQPSASGTAL